MNYSHAFFLIIFIVINQTWGNQSVTARYDNYRMYYVDLDTGDHVKLFQQLEEKSDSFQFFGHPRHPKQKLLVMTSAHRIADFEDLLTTYNLTSSILTNNFQEKINKNLEDVQPKSIKSSQYDWEHYFYLETINSWMADKVKQYPHILQTLDMGKSVEGEAMLGLKIAHSLDNKAIFIESGIHAREWIAPATATYIINELLTSNDPKIQRLARSYNWIIFPVVNPDGYKYSFEYDRMWRKNRALFGICRGVDLNRNFPYHWNITGDPCRYDYSGPSAASELETQNIINFVQKYKESEQIRSYLSLHSYSQLIMFPYGYTAERVENYDDLKEIAKMAAETIKATSGRIYKSGSIFETIYPSNGGSKDWIQGAMGINLTFTFELRGPHSSEDSFLLPADEIMPTAEEAFAAIVTIFEEGEKRGYFK